MGRLGAYLAAGVGAAAVGATAAAGVIIIDVSSFSGINGGLRHASVAILPLTPGGGSIVLYNYSTMMGIEGDSGLNFAATVGVAAPLHLSAGAVVDSSLGIGAGNTVFRNSPSDAPDFGPGSYLGFKDSQGRYAYLQVTWSNSLSQFQILSGVYEDVAGVGITIPSAAAVPEPSTLGLMALGAAGLLAARRRKARPVAG